MNLNFYDVWFFGIGFKPRTWRELRCICDDGTICKVIKRDHDLYRVNVERNGTKLHKTAWSKHHVFDHIDEMRRQLTN